MANNVICEDSNQPSPSVFNAPYEEDPNFLHRESVAKAVQQVAQGDGPILLCGESGTGKSHLALQLAYDFCKQARSHHNEEASVLWIHAKSNHSILSSFHTIALQLGLPVIDEPDATPCQMVQDWLKEQLVRHNSTNPLTSTSELFSDQRFLIVVDGLESFDLWNKALQLESKFEKYNKAVHEYKALRKYLLHGRKWTCKLIITTPHQDVADKFDVEPIILGNLTSDEAQNMCTRILGTEHKNLPDFGVMLSQKLSTNPLVVHLAAANIKHSGSTLCKYIDSVHSVHNQISSKAPPVSFIPAFRERVGERHKPNLLLAALAEQLQYLWEYCGNSDDEDDDELDAYVRFTCAVGRGGWHVPLSKSAFWADDAPTDDELPALHTLLALGLVRRIRPGFYTVTHVIQMAYWTCGRLQIGAMTDSQVNIAGVFERNYLKGRGQAHWYLPMTETVLCHPKRNLEGIFHLLDRRAHYYLSIQFFKEAWRDANSVYDVCQEMHKDDPISEPVLKALNGLAHVAHNTGEYDLALKLERLAFDGAKRLPDADRLRIRFTKDLGSTLLALSKHQDAIQLHHEMLSDLEQSYGRNAGLLACKSLLAISLANTGNVGEAFEMQKETLARLVEIYGEECHESKDALAVLVLTLDLQGRTGEATVNARHWVELEERTAGLNDLRTLWACSRLAKFLYNEGDASEAYKLLKRARDGYVQKLGPDHHKAQSMQANMDELFKNRFVGV